MSKKAKHINFHSSSATRYKCPRVLANLLIHIRCSQTSWVARLQLCLGRFGRRGERLVEGKRLLWRPFFVSHSMRSRPSAILGRTPAGTH